MSELAEAGEIPKEEMEHAVVDVSEDGESPKEDVAPEGEVPGDAAVSMETEQTSKGEESSTKLKQKYA